MKHSDNKGKRVILVTGAAQGIGKAIAFKFIKGGNNVILVDIKKKQLYKKRRNERFRRRFFLLCS